MLVISICPSVYRSTIKARRRARDSQLSDVSTAAATKKQKERRRYWVRIEKEEEATAARKNFTQYTTHYTYTDDAFSFFPPLSRYRVVVFLSKVMLCWQIVDECLCSSSWKDSTLDFASPSVTL